VAKLLADPASELFFSDDEGEQVKALEDRIIIPPPMCSGFAGGAVGDAAQSG